MLPVVFPAVCPAFVLEPVPFEALPSVVPEFIVPSDATPGVLLVPELSLPSELPVPDEEPPFPVPEVPLEEPFVFPLLIPFESPVFPPVSFPLLLSVLPVPETEEPTAASQEIAVPEQKQPDSGTMTGAATFTQAASEPLTYTVVLKTLEDSAAAAEIP